MCGLAGLLDPRGRRTATASERLVGEMADRLAHRGPDARGVWSDPVAGFAVGHRRLSVVDLSEAGHQPMVSADGRWVLAYNGELYDTDPIMSAFGFSVDDLRGRSDTEVLLEAIARVGVERAVMTVVGMFAFAAWDRQEKELWLARDRFGEKPLYVGDDDGVTLFGSELKALFAVPGFRPSVEPEAVAEFIRWSCVPAPGTILRGVRKVKPGHVLRINRNGHVISESPYWSPVEAATEALSDRSGASPTGEDAVDELDELLASVVDSRMVADVPLGGFLSGGVDSSLLAAMMVRSSDRPVQTFTIGFAEEAYDESRHAAAVADHLGTDHHDLILSPEDARAVIPSLARMYDEPFADSSQIPTALLASMARAHVTVALSGDGGDELFGGYDRYRVLQRFGAVERFMPGPFRRVVGSALRSVSADRWDRLAGGLTGRSGAVRRLGHRVHKAGRVLEADDLDGAYRAMMSSVNDASHLVLGVTHGLGGEMTALPIGGRWSGFERAMLLDTGVYLPDDLLVKVDRSSMAVSLEVRAPFLDPTLFGFAWRLGQEDRVRNGRGKWVLRRLLDRYVPSELVDRPKMGFGVPVDEWLRGPLCGWADDLLSPAALGMQGYLDPVGVADLWTRHREGRENLIFQLWPLLMFQAWLDEGWV